MTLSLILVAVALIALPGPALTSAAARLQPKPGASPARTGRRSPHTLPIAAGVIAAVLVLAGRRDAVGAVVATVAGLFTIATIHACCRDGRSPPARGGRRALPLALELIAAALRSGAPLPTAVDAVAVISGLSVGPELARAATMLRLGADPAEAWARIASVDEAGLLGAVATRSARSGMRLAETLSRQAELLRAELQTKAVRRAHRVGAVALLPLGLCYLPAFVCLGIVPMLAGLATRAAR